MTEKSTHNERPPVVVVMGHIDHGKSTLLDYIRKSNIVAGEAGGITQHIAAYEVSHKDEHGTDKKITFLDTPGHEAFSLMRARGASSADIAILVVSAEDGVKTQTIEAWKTIMESKIPFIVAINKIDKPGANIEKTKMDLAEKEIYLEGMGGDVPFVPLSAKTGEGIPLLLDLILIVAALADLSTDLSVPATGIVIESHCNPKRGISATILIKDGTLESGMFCTVDGALTGTKMIENFLGAKILSATAGSPIEITGFDIQPTVGGILQAYKTKKEAEEAVRGFQSAKRDQKTPVFDRNQNAGVKLVPLVIKTDVSGSAEAIEKEIRKLELPNLKFKILATGVGSISENDIKLAASDKETIIIGFNVKTDNSALAQNENIGATIHTADIIYKLSDFLQEIVETRKPRIEVAEILGKAKVQKTFGGSKEKQIVGGKVLEGKVMSDSILKIMRRDFEIGQAKVVNLEQNKAKTGEVTEGGEFGMMIETKTEVAPGDILEAFTMVSK